MCHQSKIAPLSLILTKDSDDLRKQHRLVQAVTANMILQLVNTSSPKYILQLQISKNPRQFHRSYYNCILKKGLVERPVDQQ